MQRIKKLKIANSLHYLKFIFQFGIMIKIKLIAQIKFVETQLTKSYPINYVH